MDLDFKSIFEVEQPTYIHSHKKYLESSLLKEGFSFEDILKDLKSNLLTSIRRDIDFFKSVENRIVEKEIQKYKAAGQKAPFSNRREYLDYLRKFKETIDNTPGTELFSTVNFKKELVSSQEAITEAMKSFDKFIEKFEKKTKTVLTNKQKQHIKMLEFNEDLGFTQEQKQEIDLIFKNLNTKLKKLSNAFTEYFENIVHYTKDMHDPHTGSSKTITDAKIVSSSRRIQEIITDMGIKFDKNQSSILNQIRKTIENMSMEKFFVTFSQSPKAREFFDVQTKNYQIDSLLGDVFEQAMFDGITNHIAENLTKSEVPMFNAKDVRMTGNISSIAQTTPIDIIFVEHTTDKDNKVFLGASLKLKAGAKAIKIEESPILSYWNSFIKFVGAKEAKKYVYMRQNLIALSTHAEDEAIQFDLNELSIFEKEIFQILSASRLLVGFYDMVDNQYKNSNSEANEFYYSAYVYGLDSILSSADILEGMLLSLEKGVSKGVLGISGLKEKTINISSEELKKLWEKKKEAGQRFSKAGKKISYKNLLTDQEVIAILKNINRNLGEHVFEGSSIGFTSSEKNMEKAAKLIGG